MKLKLTILFVLTFLFSFAQQNEKEAFQKFKKAREAFQNENYLEASNLLIETKNLLGSTNIRIQPMLIKSLAKIENWHSASDEIDKYYALKPDKNFVEYQQILKINKDVDLKIKEDQELYTVAKSDKSVSTMQSYLDTFPYGKHKDEIKSLLLTQKDENAWANAKNASNTSAYYTYLDNYPNGNYKNKAIETIKLWDKEAYQNAITDGSQKSLNYYLNNYPRGEYRDAVKEKLIERKEYDVYLKAKNNNYIENYEAYINKYPTGKYAQEVNQIIENSYFKFGSDAYKAKNYRKSIDYFNQYLNKFPSGNYVKEVNKKLKKATNKLNQHNSAFWGFTYNGEGVIAFEIGGLNVRKLGTYFNFGVNPDFASYHLAEKDNAIVSTDAKMGVANVNLGLTYSVAYPVWLYAGGGLHVAQPFVKSEENKVKELENAFKLSFSPEAGVKIRLGKVVISGGAIYANEEINYKVGLGLKF